MDKVHHTLGSSKLLAVQHWDMVWCYLIDPRLINVRSMNVIQSLMDRWLVWCYLIDPRLINVRSMNVIQSLILFGAHLLYPSSRYKIVLKNVINSKLYLWSPVLTAKLLLVLANRKDTFSVFIWRSRRVDNRSCSRWLSLVTWIFLFDTTVVTNINEIFTTCRSLFLKSAAQGFGRRDRSKRRARQWQPLELLVG